jgi:hypothetical protein
LENGRLAECIPGKDNKRRVIDKLMSNENVLLFLYDKMFPTADNPSKQKSPHRLEKQPRDILKVDRIPEMPIVENIK